MSLEIGIVLKSYVDVAGYRIDGACDLISVVIVYTASVLCDVLEGGLVKIDSLVKQSCAVLKNYNSLLKIVVDLRCVVLDPLLKLLEIIFRLDLQEEEYLELIVVQYMLFAP